MNKKGFTLIEVLISVAISLVLLIATNSVFISGNRVYVGVMGSITLRQSVRNAMDRIVRELRESNGSTITLDGNNDGSSEIIFTGPRYKDGNGVIQPIRYFLSEGQIIREFPPNTLTPVAHDITTLLFEKETGSPVADISIEAAQIINGKLLTFVLNQKVRLRNE